SSYAQQQQQENYFGSGFHLGSFFFSGGANMDSRTSSVSFAICFSTASTLGRSSAASVRRIFSSRRRHSRRDFSVSFIFLRVSIARSRALVPYSRISCTVAW